MKKSNLSLLASFLCTVVLGIIFHFQGTVFYIFVGLFAVTIISHFIVYFREKQKRNENTTI